MIRSRAGALALILLLAACTAPSPTPTESEPEPTRPAVWESPSVTATPSAPATTSATSAADPTDALLDTAGWTTYVSEQHGFAIGHPPDWGVVPADRSWAIEVDAGNWHSPALEMFWSADGHIYMAAWTAVYAGDLSLTGVDRWIDDYCRRSAEACGPESDRRVPLCSGRSCHPGLLMADEQAFFTGVHGRRITAVASGRAPDWPVPGYGSALQVLEGLLSTMGVCRVGDQVPRGCPSDTPLAGEATGDPLNTGGP